MPKSYYTYIVASRSRTLYIGVTSNLEQRIWQHKNKANKGFTATYNVSVQISPLARGVGAG